MGIREWLRMFVGGVCRIYGSAFARPAMSSKTPAPREELQEEDSKIARRQLEALKNRMGDA